MYIKGGGGKLRILYLKIDFDKTQNERWGSFQSSVYS